MATSGWLGERVINTWGNYYSRFVSNVYINSIKRNQTNIVVSGTISLSAYTNSSYCYYYYPVNVYANGVLVGEIKPQTGDRNIKNNTWTKNFSVTVNAAQNVTSASLPIKFLDPVKGWTNNTQTYTLNFDKAGTAPSGITSTIIYTPYDTIEARCASINWGTNYSYRKLTCIATYTYQGKTETFKLGEWTDGATSKNVVKDDFNFPADLIVTITWEASSDIGSIKSSKQVEVKKTKPKADLSNVSFTAESIDAYIVKVNVSGIDFGYNNTKTLTQIYLEYDLDNVSYSTLLIEDTSGDSSLEILYDATNNDSPWTLIPDDCNANVVLLVDNGNGVARKTIQLYCQPSYEAQIVESIPDEDKQISQDYTGQDFQLENNTGNFEPLHAIEIYGNTTQAVYTGKNLFDTQTTPAYLGSATTSLVTNGIRVTTSNAGTYRYAVFLVGTREEYVGQTMTLKRTLAASSSNKGTFGIGYCDSTGGTRQVISTKNTSNQSITTTITDNDSSRPYIYIILYSNTDGTQTKNLYVDYTNIQLEVGSSATDYEPYCGKIASPNPDYPQIVKNITERQELRISGKNLYQFETKTADSAGVTFEYRADGTIRCHGTATGTASVNSDSRVPIRFKALQTYVISANNQFVNSNVTVRFNRGNGKSGVFGSTTLTEKNKTWTITESTDTDAVLQVRLQTGHTYDFEIRPQIEVGTTATAYEKPHQNKVEINLGKNLWNPTPYKAGYTINSSTGAETSNSSWDIFGNILVTEPTIFTLSATASTSGTISVYLYKLDGTWIGRKTYKTFNKDVNTNMQINVNTQYPCLMRWCCTKNQKEAQLERNYLQSEYIPYFNKIELCKIGDYQDYIWNDNGTWKIHKEVGKVVVDGTTELTLHGTVGGIIGARLPVSEDAKPSGTAISPIKCDHFQSVKFDTYYNSRSYGEIASHNSTVVSNLYITAPNSSITTVADFKTWLSTHNTAVYYALETPIDVEITDAEAIKCLDNIIKDAYLFEGFNNLNELNTTGEQVTNGEIKFSYYTKFQKFTQAILSVNAKNGANQYKEIRRIR